MHRLPLYRRCSAKVYILVMSLFFVSTILAGCGKEDGDTAIVPSDEPGDTTPANNTADQPDRNNRDSTYVPPIGVAPDETDESPDEEEEEEPSTPDGPAHRPHESSPCDGCTASQLCINDQCVTDSCALPQDLGLIAQSQTHNLTGTNEDGGNIAKVSCASSESQSAKETVYAFRLAEDARVSLKLSNSDGNDWIAEIRKDQCHHVGFDPRRSADPTLPNSDENELSNVVGCYRGASAYHEVSLQADTDYFLILKPSQNVVGSYNVELKIELQVCEPQARQCASQGSSTINVCSPSGLSRVPFSCAGSCFSGTCNGEDCCRGNSCDSPFDLTLSDDVPVYTYHGETRAYTNTVDFEHIQLLTDSPPTGMQHSCVDGNLETRATDVFFVLRDIEEGETITIDAQNKDIAKNNADANNAMNFIYILGQCPHAQTTAVECMAFAPSKFGALSWTAPRAGDFYVVIDRASMVQQTNFVYRICKGSCPPYSSQ